MVSYLSKLFSIKFNKGMTLYIQDPFKEMPESFFGIFKVLPTIMSVHICIEGTKDESGPLDWLINLKCLRSEFPNVPSYADRWGERGMVTHERPASGTRSFICASSFILLFISVPLLFLSKIKQCPNMYYHSSYGYVLFTYDR